MKNKDDGGDGGGHCHHHFYPNQKACGVARRPFVEGYLSISICIVAMFLLDVKETSIPVRGVFL